MGARPCASRRPASLCWARASRYWRDWRACVCSGAACPSPMLAAWWCASAPAVRWPILWLPTGWHVCVRSGKPIASRCVQRPWPRSQQASNVGRLICWCATSIPCCRSACLVNGFGTLRWPATAWPPAMACRRRRWSAIRPTRSWNSRSRASAWPGAPFIGCSADPPRAAQALGRQGAAGSL